MNSNKKAMDGTEKQLDERNIITEFRILSKEDLRMQKVESYNNCDLCGSELDFTHVTNFISQDVLEEASCPHCKIQTKKVAHPLQ